MFIHIPHPLLQISLLRLVLQCLRPFPKSLVPNFLIFESMSATVSVADKALTPAMARRGRRRGRGQRDQATSSAGREMSESEEKNAGDVGDGNLCGMISREFCLITLDVADGLCYSVRTNTKPSTENRFAFLSATEPAPGARPGQTIPAPPQSAFTYRYKKPKSTPSFPKASSRGHDPFIPKEEGPVSQSAFIFNPNLLTSKSPSIDTSGKKDRARATAINRRAKEASRLDTQGAPEPDPTLNNPRLPPQSFPSIAPSTDVKPGDNFPTLILAPPSRPPDGGPIYPPPIPYPPNSLLTPPPSPPGTKLQTKPHQEPSCPAEALLDGFKARSGGGWPDLTNEPMAPATKDKKSRFLPYFTAIATSKNTLRHSACTQVGTGKKGRDSPPSPLDLESISLASPGQDDTPVLVRTDTGEGLQSGNKKKRPWRLWGNDMSHLRLKTSGFVDTTFWAMKSGEVDDEKDVGEGEICEFYEGEAYRKWSLGEEWEVIELE